MIREIVRTHVNLTGMIFVPQLFVVMYVRRNCDSKNKIRHCFIICEFNPCANFGLISMSCANCAFGSKLGLCFYLSLDWCSRQDNGGYQSTGAAGDFEVKGEDGILGHSNTMDATDNDKAVESDWYTRTSSSLASCKEFL
jgi:hypothetical protein